MRPLLPRPDGGHDLHAGSSGGLGYPGEPVPPAAGPTLRDGCGLWFVPGVLPVQPGGTVLGVLGLPAGPGAPAAERDPGPGLHWILDHRLVALAQEDVCTEHTVTELFTLNTNSTNQKHA